MKKAHQHLVMYSMMVSLFVLALLLVSYVSSKDTLLERFSEASQTYTLQSNVLTSYSEYDDSSTYVKFDLSSQGKSQGLYTLNGTTAQDVIEFIDKDPVFTLSGAGSQKPLIPETTQNLRLKTNYSDAQLDETAAQFGLANVDTGASHFYFEQTRCGNVPIFGSYVNVHVSDQSQVYAISGALTQADTRCQKNITTEEAQARAQSVFAETYGTDALYIQESEEVVWSPEVFGQSGSQNYLTEYTVVCSEAYCRGYFVDYVDGTIRDSVQVTTDAKNRYVFLGSTQRTEGQSPVSNQEVNRAYDIMGEVWDYYNTAHNRDSYNGSGGRIQVRLSQCNQIQASWDGRQISACTGVNDTDVLAHEFQHGVTQHTAGLVYRNESGALNESLSDVFGAVIDSDDWLMGEEGIKAIRSLQNPPQFNHPDTMVSSKFYCGSQDNGGVHINSGVLNKAFYLMSDGGSFNGCTINGLGRDRAVQAIYKALTTYMIGKQSGSYKDMYNAINLGCNDVYGSGSAECQNIKAAMESTYMDQKSRCNGGKAGTTTCAGGQPPQPSPTGTQPSPTSGVPSPTGTQPSPTTGVPSPSPIPTESQSTVVETDLLSTLSSPEFISGSVRVSKTGSQFQVNSQLNAASLTSLNLSNLNFASLDDIVLQVRGRLIGEDILETGAFVLRDGVILNEFSTDKDVSKYDSYQVYFETTDSHNELPVLVASLTRSGEDTDGSDASIILDLTLRFQGVERKPSETQAQLVRIGLSGGDLEETVYRRVVFTPQENGLWKGRVTYPGLSDITNGAIRVKGPKHIQKKYCNNAPQESGPGFYSCEEDAIVLRQGVNTLDFSKVTQLAGDINQDGRVNAVDINIVRSSLGSTAVDDIVFGDMNNDGVVNSIDDGLNLFTLSNRPEQN